MNDRLTSQDVSALLTLMAVAREISNTELAELTGIRITGDVRRRLNDAGFVTSAREGNKPFVHALTDKGLRRCRYEFKTERPARPGYYGYAFFAVLNGLDRFLDRENRQLADVFQPAFDETLGIEARIQLAYRKLAPRPGDWVPLADLRRELNGAPKDEVDSVLKALGRSQRVTLAPNPSGKSITAADRAAAVPIGGDENHLIAIEES
jgi:hypothetical protein